MFVRRRLNYSIVDVHHLTFSSHIVTNLDDVIPEWIDVHRVFGTIDIFLAFLFLD
jgi:hypothetical protein